jgi:ASC-1-like (ASCH) protein
MQLHNLNLATEPFVAISNGQKTVESRLYDDKRQSIKINDRITFTNRDNPSQAVGATVVGLLRYATFYDLFSHNEPTKFGGQSVEWLLKQINEFYSAEDQIKYGVIGIEFVVDNLQ